MSQKKKWLCYLICLIAALCIGAAAELIHYAILSSKTTDIDSSKYTCNNLSYDASGNTFTSQDKSKESNVEYDLSGQYISNIVLTLKEFDSKEAERGAKILITTDKGQINSYDENKSKQYSFQYFEIPRTIEINDNIETLNISIDNMDGASLNVSFNAAPHYNFFIMLAVALIAFIVTSAIIGIIRNELLKPEIVAATIIVLMGIILSVFLPPEYTFDEKSHYIRSYNFAINNYLYDFHEEEAYPVGLESYLNEEHWIYDNYEDYINYQTYAEQYRINNTEIITINTPQVVYTPLPYISSGIGIKIAKWLDLSILQSIYWARILNVLFYAIVSFFAIRIVPKNKLFFLLFFTLPINIFVASSLGTDFFLNALLSLAVAMIYRFKIQDKRITAWEYCILVIVLCLIPCAKSTYAPVLLLLGALDKEKLPKNLKPVINYALGIALMFVTFLVTYLYGSRFGIVMWGRENLDSARQIDFILHNPFKAAYAFMYTTIHDFKTLLITKYEHFAYLGMGSGLAIFEIIGLLALSLFRKKDDDFKVKLSPWNVVFLILTVIGCYFTSMLALYTTFTPVGSDFVEGFQGRYCIPIVLILYLIIMSVNKLKIRLKRDIIDTSVCFGVCLIGMIWLVSMMSVYV